MSNSATGIAIQPMQWSQLPDINDVTDFTPDDEQCFRELRDVLKKYDALDRFGLTLLHSHFDVADDEVMLETTDVDARTHLVRPVKRASLNDEAYSITNWKLAEGDDVVARVCVCARTSNGHTRGHAAQ
jgi:hypothetical protein